MELILNIICVLIPLVYLIAYVIKQNKKRKKNYLYGLVVAIVLGLILFVIRLFILTIVPVENKVEESKTTTTVSTTVEYPETNTTTSKTTEPIIEFQRLEVPTGGEVLGTTSKGYEVKKIDGLYYVDGYLIANKTYDLPKTYNPGGVNTVVRNAANKMFTAAKNEKGFSLYIGSGFRSYDTQNSIYNNYVSRDGKAQADTYSARPGYSEHQTGYAMDICDKNVSACITSAFDSTEQAKWLAENAHKYGFILRYVKNKDNETGYMYESWHFRYVGTDLSYKLYNNGNWITMEEYFGITSSYDNKPIGE